jgi:hypothetical protein
MYSSWLRDPIMRCQPARDAGYDGKNRYDAYNPGGLVT